MTVLLVVAVLATVVDVASTAYALGVLGLQELNPAAKVCIEAGGLALGLVTIAAVRAAILVWATVVHREGRLRVAAVALVAGLCCWWVTVDVSNVAALW